MYYLEGLNKDQKKAAMHIKGPLLVVAGAGTGKTKTLVHRILHLISSGVSPYVILAITFTNKAASEMQNRIGMILDDDSELPTVSTFHALGVLILREQHRVIGINKYFNILDSQDKLSLIKKAMKKEDIEPKEWEPKKIANAISKAKADEKNPESYTTTLNPLTNIVKLLWPKYEELKQLAGALDFDDLLSETYLLLKNNIDIQKHYQERWQYIHVDEYQDTNTIQYKIIKLLANIHNNICAVGDGDQNIYSWRGADMKNILNFEKDFPGAKVILLEKNYRSTQNILQASHEIISKNTERIEKKLMTDNSEGSKLLVFEGFSAHHEASWVADKVKDYICSDTEPRDIAVLFRTNFQSRILEEAFLKKMIPYQVLGIKFFSRKEIKILMSYLKAAFNRESLSDMGRIINEPKRSLGKVSIAKIFSGQIDQLSNKARVSYKSFICILDDIYEYTKSHVPSETIKYIIKHSGFEEKLKTGSDEDKERLQNMKELVSYARKYDKDVLSYDHFFEEVALLSDQDILGSNTKSNNTVKLMTIHASKGLEFKYVFIVGLEQGLFPVQRDDRENKYEDEEERRLCYVAFTRAKEILHLSYAKFRTIYGEERMNEPSEFLIDIPDDIIEYDDVSSLSFTSRNKIYHKGDDNEVTSYLDF